MSKPSARQAEAISAAASAGATASASAASKSSMACTHARPETASRRAGGT